MFIAMIQTVSDVLSLHNSLEK